MAKNPGLRARARFISAGLTAANAQPAKARPKADGGEGKNITARIPGPIHKDLRRIAYEKERSIQSLILEGLEAVVKKYS